MRFCEHLSHSVQSWNKKLGTWQIEGQTCELERFTLMVQALASALAVPVSRLTKKLFEQVRFIDDLVVIQALD